MPDDNNFDNLSDEEYEQLLKPLIDENFEPVSNLNNSYVSPAPSKETLQKVETFEKTIDLIKQGNFPKWSDFFTMARKLNEDYFNEHGESTSLADELISVYEIDVEEVYIDSSFLNEIILMLPDEIHFVCFILNSEHSKKIDSTILEKMWQKLCVNSESVSCYDCGMNRWWGNPVAYLAIMDQLPTKILAEIFNFTLTLDERYSHDVQIIQSALASNLNTPLIVLESLTEVNKVTYLPFENDLHYDEKNEQLLISQLAKNTIQLINSKLNK